MRSFSIGALLCFAILLPSCSPTTKQPRMVQRSFYGKVPDGRDVFEYTLTNDSGNTVKIITFGATVTSIVVPDRNGKKEDVVLGYDSLSGYLHDKSYFGAIVGRYGNRIKGGKFSLFGKEYQLTINEGENHLHGGKGGFHQVLFDVVSVRDTSEPGIELRFVSPEGDEGYPGTLSLKVLYTWTNKNELRIDYTAITERATVLNPTQHSYFNLTGSPENTILDHVLEIEADSITPVGKGLIPTGAIAPVAGTPMDFRTPTVIGAHINDGTGQLTLGKGYDHNWVLRDFTGDVREVAELYDPGSGRLLSVRTDQPGLQFYSGNFLDGTVRGKKGIMYKHRTGLCLEAQHYPDSPNKPQFPSVVLTPGKVYRQTTIYQFLTKQ